MTTRLHDPGRLPSVRLTIQVVLPEGVRVRSDLRLGLGLKLGYLWIVYGKDMELIADAMAVICQKSSPWPYYVSF